MHTLVTYAETYAYEHIKDHNRGDVFSSGCTVKKLKGRNVDTAFWTPLS